MAALELSSGTTSTAITNYNIDAALKEHYKPQRIKNMVYKHNPLLALMPKGNDSTSELRQFLLTRVKDYSFA